MDTPQPKAEKPYIGKDRCIDCGRRARIHHAARFGNHRIDRLECESCETAWRRVEYGIAPAVSA